jgi:hypothetical protein
VNASPACASLPSMFDVGMNVGLENARHHATANPPRLLRQSRLRASATAKLKSISLQTESVVTNGGDEMFHAPPEGYVRAVCLWCLFARLI